jgi:membrane dipeptidase
MPTRRRFLRNAALGAAGVLASGPLPGIPVWASPPAPRAPLPPGVFADLHFHASLRATVRETPPAVASPLLDPLAQMTFNRTGGSWEECHRAGIDLVCAVHYNPLDEMVSMAVDPSLDAPRHTHRMFDLLEAELSGEASVHARLARNPEALRAALADRAEGRDDRVIVLHAIEGGHALGGSAASLDGFAARGAVFMTLTHFLNKGLSSVGNALPFFPDAGSDWPHQGLTDLGRQVIARMEALGVLLDVTHASSTAMVDIFKTAKRPFMASHTSVRALGDHPYSMPDEHLREIADRGGLIGIVLFPYTLSNYATYERAIARGSLADVVRSVRYLVKILGGHRSIAIGSDFSGFIAGPKEMNRLGQVDRLRAALMAEFGDQDLVTDVMSRNATRFLSEHWGHA